jgi:hypothetical protein
MVQIGRAWTRRGGPVTRQTLDVAFDEVSSGSAGGAPFLIAFGATILLTAVAALSLSVKTAALVLLFQGNVALPAAFWLERRMGWRQMAADNPLRTLSIQLAMSQILGIPAVVIVYAVAPWAVPGALAAIAGAHFLPYAWLQRSPIYMWLAIAVSIGGCAITMILQQNAFAWVLFYMAACYGIAAPLVYRRAQAISIPPLGDGPLGRPLNRPSGAASKPRADR